MKHFLLAAVVAIGIAASPGAAARDDYDGGPSPEGMLFDLVIMRPVGLVGTVLGAAVFVVALPISITIGAPPSAPAKRLVVEPFMYTFARPLGED